MKNKRWDAEEESILLSCIRDLGTVNGIKAFMQRYPDRTYKACSLKYNRLIALEKEYEIQDLEENRPNDSTVVENYDRHKKEKTSLFKKLCCLFKKLFS